MTPEIRDVREDEIAAYVDALSTGFLERPDVDLVAREIWPLWRDERNLAAFDGDRICGTFRSWSTEITVPGGAALPVAGLSGVTVLPTHRRRGILRAMVETGHRRIREDGAVFGLLWASEYPIYGRFGYGPATREATWSLDTAATGFTGVAVGTIELARPTDDVRDAIRDVFDASRTKQVGEIRRRERTWDFDLGLRQEFWGSTWKGFVALHRTDAGEVDGFARYHVEEHWERRQPRNTLVVDDLHGLDEGAVGGLWRFLADIDWVTTVRAARRSPADALPWRLTNGRAAVLSEVGDATWLRVFDVARALAARTYEREARVVLEIVDEEAPGGRARFELDAGREGATCVPTTRDPDLTIHASALGAAYLGGSRLRLAVLARGVDEHRMGTLDRLDALLRTADEPWCSSFF